MHLVTYLHPRLPTDSAEEPEFEEPRPVQAGRLDHRVTPKTLERSTVNMGPTLDGWTIQMTINSENNLFPAQIPDSVVKTNHPSQWTAHGPLGLGGAIVYCTGTQRCFQRTTGFLFAGPHGTAGGKEPCILTVATPFH